MKKTFSVVGVYVYGLELFFVKSFLIKKELKEYVQTNRLLLHDASSSSCILLRLFLLLKASTLPRIYWGPFK